MYYICVDSVVQGRDVLPLSVPLHAAVAAIWIKYLSVASLVAAVFARIFLSFSRINLCMVDWCCMHPPNCLCLRLNICIYVNMCLPSRDRYIDWSVVVCTRAWIWITGMCICPVWCSSRKGLLVWWRPRRTRVVDPIRGEKKDHGRGCPRSDPREKKERRKQKNNLW